MKQISFETIGSAFQEPKASNLTGRQHGATVAVMSSSAVVEKLASQTPFETMANLKHSLEKRYGLSRNVKATVMVGEPEYAMVPIGVADYEGAIAAVKASMTPCPDSVLEKALALLSSRCAGRRGDGDETGFKVAVVKNDLRAYPVDVVLFVLEEWSKINRWLPERADLFPKLEALTQKRRDMLYELEWSAKQPTSALLPKPAPERPVSFQEAPVLTRDPAPPIRSAQSMAEALRGMSD